ncbi:efflux RND transporter periplasmic adaptor subunit [Marinicella litoralis]|uniref:Membrane fusion protein (Multidrug efflux system) n=1 Tax=Marinicella litoralis TaxID=644220 RepID=A0A4R6XC20_9GAMM|nr:efflux RND transporter periplasmic adaptor subunit [Marinicella litoralis]TDR16792.1 membrane fusion protein (multidrug efflux system) [Marinicella litoralis]
MKNKIVLLIIITLLAIAGYWIYSHYFNVTQSPQNGSATIMKVNVTAVEVHPEDVTMKIVLPGRTAAYKQSQVRPQVSGIIKQRMFKEGSLVEKGQQLYQLDGARYEANLRSAKANLQSAKANFKAIKARYNRILLLIEKKAVSQQDLDDVEAQLDQANAAISVAEANVALEQINVDYSHVYAPISGRIGKSNLTVGALVTAGQADSLATITQLDPIYVDMQVAGTESVWVQQQISSGAAIEVALKGQGYEAFTGVLEFSDVTVNETTGSVGLRALMDNSEGGLLPGLFVNAEINLGQQKHILVPQRATTRNPSGELVVWLVGPDNLAKPQVIQVNKAQGNSWIVTAGLKAGDRVVVEGYQKLQPGSEVIVSNWDHESVSNTKDLRG